MQRMTRQRRAILEAFRTSARPLSPQEITDLATKEVPGLNLATVYRNLRAMVDAGTVTVIELLGQPARYELPGLEHHHHFHCERCDRVFDLEDCPGTLEGLVPTGFVVAHHEIQLTGVCADCAS